MKKLLLILFPKYKNDFWYNHTIHSSDVNYSVFDEKGAYINCVVGLEIQLKDGLYKVIKVWRHNPGGDWLYPSDCIQCDLKKIQ